MWSTEKKCMISVVSLPRKHILSLVMRKPQVDPDSGPSDNNYDLHFLKRWGSGTQKTEEVYQLGGNKRRMTTKCNMYLWMEFWTREKRDFTGIVGEIWMVSEDWKIMSHQWWFPKLEGYIVRHPIYNLFIWLRKRLQIMDIHTHTVYVRLKRVNSWGILCTIYFKHSGVD